MHFECTNTDSEDDAQLNRDKKMVGVGGKRRKKLSRFCRKEDKSNDSDNNGEAPRSQALEGPARLERQRQEESIWWLFFWHPASTSRSSKESARGKRAKNVSRRGGWEEEMEYQHQHLPTRMEHELSSCNELERLSFILSCLDPSCSLLFCFWFYCLVGCHGRIFTGIIKWDFVTMKLWEPSAELTRKLRTA